VFTLGSLAQVVREVDPSLTFTSVEIGALPLEGETEPAHRLLDAFPGSRAVAFELNPQVCALLNRQARRGLQFYPVALGRTEETRPLYEAAHPMCTSLYRPNQALLDCFTHLDDARLKAVSSVSTVSLDRFAAEHELGRIDFVKMDVQGAELDILAGGAKALQDVACIVSEVEFVPLYENQPLFGDVCALLAQRGLMFHKFLGAGGRSMKLASRQDTANDAVQLLWADAMFVRDTVALKDAAPDRLLRSAVLACLYDSPDLTLYCLEIHDRTQGTRTVDKLLPRGG
jgi:FkbM family methyltransferase